MVQSSSESLMLFFVFLHHFFSVCAFFVIVYLIVAFWFLHFPVFQMVIVALLFLTFFSIAFVLPNSVHCYFSFFICIAFGGCRLVPEVCFFVTVVLGFFAVVVLVDCSFTFLLGGVQKVSEKVSGFSKPSNIILTILGT